MHNFAIHILAALLLAIPSAAIDVALCDDDGVTEVPSYASGRDEYDCLLVDPGNGDDPVKFQYEFLNLTDLHSEQNLPINDNCPTEGQQIGCTYLLDGVIVDNYLAQTARNKDIWKTSIRANHILIKNSIFRNGWLCKEAGWQGPNDIECDIGCCEDEINCGLDPGDCGPCCAHSDGIQMRRNPVEGGWVVFQDSELSNAYNATCRFSDPTAWGDQGSYLFQGFKTHQYDTPFGESTNYQEECLERGGGERICTENECFLNAGGSEGLNEVWLIDIQGVVPWSFGSDHHKTVIINTGCGSTGCNGTVEYVNGWPWPIHSKAANVGPGNCPDGLVLQNPHVGTVSSDATFCYNSLDAMEADVSTGSSANQGDCPSQWCPHKLAPFVYLSDTGWKDTDSDGVIDRKDFCSALANAPSPAGCDTNNDGYGNLCDGDFNQDGVVNAADAAIINAALSSGDTSQGTDMNCDGVMTSADVAPFQAQQALQVPGPSGLTCAGEIPCQ